MDPDCLQQRPNFDSIITNATQFGSSVNAQTRKTNVPRDCLRAAPTCKPPAPSLNRKQLDDSLIWCEDCKCAVLGDCVTHPVAPVPDQKIPSRARLTLPRCLSIADISGELGIMAKKLVTKRSRFGPLEAPTVRGDQPRDGKPHLFKLFSTTNSWSYFDTSSEDSCNWLMFMRPARVFEEQNIVAYQSDGCIYFLTTQTIRPGAELKFWYAEPYAEMMGFLTLVPEEVQCLETTAADDKVPKSLPVRDCFSCDLCEEIFDSLEGLESHACSENKDDDEGRRTRNKRKGKPQKLPSRATTRRLKTSTDGALRRTENKMRRVREQAHCHECQQEFNTSRRLALHMFVHTGEMPYKCDKSECGKSFNTRFKLIRHTQTHSSTRQHSCTACGKAFVRKDHLKNHLILHDDNRETYTCHYNNCGKGYSTLLAFRTHVAFHKAGEGSLQCDICSAPFESKDNLIVHIKVHAGSRTVKGALDKKFGCTMCDKRFFTQKDVRRHSITHTKERNFSCVICTQKFGRRDHLTRHIRKNHNGSEDGNKKSSKERRREQPPPALPADLNKSIQQILAESNISIDSMGSPHSMSPPDSHSAIHVTPLLPANDKHSAHDFLSVPVFPGGSSLQGQRIVTLNTLLNSFVPIATTSDGTCKHRGDGQSQQSINIQPLTWQPVIMGDNNAPRYQIMSDGRNTGATLLIADNQSLNVDALSRPSLILETCDGRLNGDVSNTEYNEAMKVLSNLTAGSQLLSQSVHNDHDLNAMFVQSTYSQSNINYR